MSVSRLALYAGAFAALLPAVSGAVPVIDAAGDFIPTYAGPRTGDLDALRADVQLTGANFLFTATLAAPAGTTPGGFYVWGVDRGQGTARFGVIMGAGGTTYETTRVLFDSVLIVRPGGQSQVNDLLTGATSLLDAAAVAVSGSDLSALVPASFFPSTGRTLEQYEYNFWPRITSAVGNAQLSDFAPNNGMARVSVPEPATVALIAAGALLAAGRTRRQRCADPRG